MIEITLPKWWISYLSDYQIKKIVENLFGTDEEIDLMYASRSTGRYIEVENTETEEKHFICFSNPWNDGRNSHLMQFLAPTYIAFFEDNRENKYLDIFLINPDKNDKTDYIIFFYKCFLTLGINILNFNELHLGNITPFSSYKDVKESRNTNRDRNTWNRSTFFTDDDSQISFYGKCFWANEMETFLLLLVLREITSKKIVYYPVFDNDSKKISDDKIKILQQKGIHFWETISEINNDNIKLNKNWESLRDTPKFHYNLLKKYWEKKCFLCGCDLEHLIIWSHIERVTDIENSNIYSDEEKIRRIVDGDNGFRLCANHDKMFEYWTIFFEWQNLKHNENLKAEDKVFIERSIVDFRKLFNTDNLISDTFKINESLFNEHMREYLQKHFNRIKGIK